MIQGDLPLDQYFNPLSNEHYRSIHYTNNIELEHSTYIRDMYIYAQIVNGAQVTCVELINTINQKISVVGEYFLIF